MRQVTADRLTDLLAEQQPPCISLYQPTHRSHPDSRQDPIRFRNLLREIEESLRRNYPKRDVRSALEKFHALAENTHFWEHRTDGLAILNSPNKFLVLDLQRPVEELVVVADRFHTKPLLRVLQSADRYQILSLSRQEAKLHEGNRYALDPVELENVPATITEALGAELTEPHQTVASYGKGAGGPHSAHGEPAMYHGHGARKDETEIDRERFFRVIDRAILEHHSRPSGLPLLLAALPEHHAPFRQISRNPHLAERGIEQDPDALGPDQLRAAAWRIMEPYYLQRLAKLVNDYETAKPRQAGSDDLAGIAEAAVAGRVGTLLVEADREVPGKIDAATGEVRRTELADPATNDLLDDLAQIVLRKGGEVVIVPAERMPSATGAAATYRY